MSEKVSLIVRQTLDQAMNTDAGGDFMKYLLDNNRANEVSNFYNGDKLDTLNAFDSAFDLYTDLIKKSFRNEDNAQFNNWKKKVKEITKKGKEDVKQITGKEKKPLSAAFSKVSILNQMSSVSKKTMFSSKDPVERFTDFLKKEPLGKHEKKGFLANTLGDAIGESSRKERLDQLGTIENIFLKYSCSFDSYLENNQTTREKISRLPPRQFLDEILKMSNNLWFCGDISSDTVEYIKKLLSNVHSKVEMQSNSDSKIIKNIDDFLKNNSFSQFLRSEFCNYGENALSEYLGLYITAYESELDKDVLNELRNLYEALIKKEIRESNNKGVLTLGELRSSKKDKFMSTTSPFILPKAQKNSKKPSTKSSISKTDIQLQNLLQGLRRPTSSKSIIKEYGDSMPVCMNKTKTSNRMVLYDNKPLELINVLGDGSCFYHSIAHILRKLSNANGAYSSVTGHELRKQFVDYLKEKLTESLLENKDFAVEYIFKNNLSKSDSSNSQQILKNLEKLLNITENDFYDESSILFHVNNYLRNQDFERIENLVKILLGSIRNTGNYFNQIQVAPFANFLKIIGTLQNFQTTIDGFIVLNVSVSNNGISTYPIAVENDNRIMVYLRGAHYNAVKKVGTGDFNDYVFSARKSNWSRDIVKGTNIHHEFFQEI